MKEIISSYYHKPSGYRMCYTERGRGKAPQYEHRVLWENSNGVIPSDKVIDHINGIRDDNRLENLRVVTPLANCYNRVATPKGVCPVSTDKRYKGVQKKKWRDQLGHEHIGVYDSEEEATAVYLQALELKKVEVGL